MERGFNTWPGMEPERLEKGKGRSPEEESAVDLRSEHEIFRDHERLDAQDKEDGNSLDADELAETKDGIIYIAIPAYDYDFSTNPFVGMAPHMTYTYEVSRHLDVTFLHRFMYQDIVVCGLRSREFVPEQKRAAFIKHIRQTGGVPQVADSDVPYEFAGVKFSPYVEYHTTAAFFARYHKQPPLSEERPHYPLDVWMIFDANAYEEVAPVDFRRGYRLRPGYERRSALLGLAQIN